MPKHDLKSMDESALVDLAKELGEAGYRGRQLHEWLVVHGAADFATMHTLPADFRAALEKCSRIRSLEEVETQVSTDKTRKTAYRLDSGRLIETVIIPEFDDAGAAKRITVCVSSQVGCAMACSFCATGQMGFHQNLLADEIYDQVRLSNEISISQFDKKVSNVVFMGMGEPLLNYAEVTKSVRMMTDDSLMNLSKHRVTVSTVGLAGQIRRFADDKVPANLAISLHAPNDEKRSSIMPVNRKRKTDLTALKDSVVHYAAVTGKEVMYEYCMFSDFNDSIEDARQLAEVARWAPCKINLILYNSVDGLGFQRTSEENVNRFIHELVTRGALVTVRRSRGQDIAAACGQLATANT